MGKKLLEFWTDDKKAIPALYSKTAQVFFGKPAQLLVANIEIDRGLLGVSEPRVYQLIARAKAIGREYRQKNG